MLQESPPLRLVSCSLTPHSPESAKKESPDSPLAGDLITKFLACLADLSFCRSYFLLHSTFCALHAAASFEVTIGHQLTKFSFRRTLHLLRLTFDFILVTHITPSKIFAPSPPSPPSYDSSATGNQLENQDDQRHHQQYMYQVTADAADQTQQPKNQQYQ